MNQNKEIKFNELKNKQKKNTDSMIRHSKKSYIDERLFALKKDDQRIKQKLNLNELITMKCINSILSIFIDT